MSDTLAPELVEPYLLEQSNRSLQRGGVYATWFLIISALALGALAVGAAGHEDLRVPAMFATTSSVMAIGITFLARRRWVSGWVRYAVALGFVSLPTLMLLMAAPQFPATGAATFLVGPLSFLYLLFLAVTGFMFEARVTQVAGVAAALEYGLCVWLARSGMATVQTGSAQLTSDVASGAAGIVKCAMILVGGLFIAALASAAQRLILQVLQEEREKLGISRLFGQFVSPAVREKVLREKAETIGELKQVVVLFSDVRGFTTWSEGTDPAVLVLQLNEYFDGMVTAITRNGGVVDKFIGDAVMAVFGGLIELPNPSLSALNAALEMRRCLGALNERWKKEGRPTLDNGIGLHFGQVLQGTIGSSDRKEFTVIGDTVNVASRLESSSKDLGSHVIVSATVLNALPEADRAVLRPLGSTLLKGKALPIEVFGAD